MKLAIEYPYLCKDRDRHGNVRFYFRRNADKKVRIRAKPGTSEFQAAYDAAKAAAVAKGEVASPGAVSRPQPGTFRWLCVRYFGSTDFKELDPKTQTVRRHVLEHICDEVIAPGRSETYADFLLNRMTAKAVRVLRDRKAGLPEAANVRIKAVRRLFAWAMEDEFPGVTSNPARDVKYLRGRQGGHHSWTVDEVEQYEQRHPVGTTARLPQPVCSAVG